MYKKHRVVGRGVMSEYALLHHPSWTRLCELIKYILAGAEGVVVVVRARR